MIRLADSDEMQAAANSWVQAHPLPDHSALTADGKRINGVNRNAGHPCGRRAVGLPDVP